MNLPGIRKIYTVDATTLSPQLESKAIAGLPITIPSGLNEIKFFGDATCSVEEKYENNGMVEEVELSFATNKQIDTNKRLAFFVYDVNDETYLIGAEERPFTLIVQSHDTSASTDNKAIWYIKVTSKRVIK